MIIIIVGLLSLWHGAWLRWLCWLVEQCFTSPPTQYRLYGRRFLQVKRSNQQYQSTEAEDVVLCSGVGTKQTFRGSPLFTSIEVGRCNFPSRSRHELVHFWLFRWAVLLCKTVCTDKLGILLRGRKDTFTPAVSALRGRAPLAPAVPTHLWLWAVSVYECDI